LTASAGRRRGCRPLSLIPLAFFVGTTVFASAGGDGTAAASVGLTTTVVSKAVVMTNTSSSQTPVTASCAAGSTLVGGGIFLGPGQPGALYTNGLKINGSQPADAGNGAANPVSWTAVGGFGGQSDANDTATSSVVCATGGPAATVVVSASIAGTNANPGAGLGPVIATCPSATSLLGGGVRTVPPNDGSLKPIASYPSDGAGTPAVAGVSNPRSWTAISRNSSAGGPSDGYTPTTTVFALCARSVVKTVVAEASAVLSTATSGAVLTATATCPSGTVLFSGGVNMDDGNEPAGPSHFGIHLIADDATTADGKVVSGGATASWTAVAHTGGIPATVGVHAFAVCAVPSGTSSVDTTTGSGAGTPTSVGVDGRGASSAVVGQGATGSRSAGGTTSATSVAPGATTPQPSTAVTASPGTSGSVGGSSPTVGRDDGASLKVPQQQAIARSTGARSSSSSNPALWIVAMIVAGSAVAAVLGRKRITARLARESAG
jgi:hypothetical protein